MSYEVSLGVGSEGGGMHASLHDGVVGMTCSWHSRTFRPRSRASVRMFAVILFIMQEQGCLHAFSPVAVLFCLLAAAAAFPPAARACDAAVLPSRWALSGS